MKLQKTKHALISGIALTILPAAVQAATLASFDWEGGPTGSANGFTPATISGFEVTGLTGFSYQADGNAANGTFYNGTSGARHNTPIRTSNVTADTSTFTTSSTSGQTVTYESFSGLFSSSAGNINIDLSYSIDGGTSVAAGSFNPPEGNVPNGSQLDDSASAFDFTDFSTDKSVVWTLTFTALNNANDRMRFDDWELTGNVAAVPEPSSTALLGLGAVALVMRRRK
ncbi:PEP-CTERM sorting domain-containing protein [Rubritalea spongiae]|uniref:PEP-CTERM sorting domain-containing protein n=1 Tax=Rubritalea spongiae TaxID=430797 RepID=A0ABW5DZM1_9BACT